MKLLSIQFLITTTCSWRIDLEIESRNAIVNFEQIWKIDVKSDAGGEAVTQCKSFDFTKLNCENGSRVTSNQGGYLIKGLECDKSKCKMNMETVGIQFDLEVEAKCDYNHYDLENGDRLDRRYCWGQRYFKVRTDGRIKYIYE